MTESAKPLDHSPGGHVLSLVKQLAAAENGLSTMLGDAADTVIDSAGHAHLLREAQKALQQSEHRFRALVENSTDVIALLTADGRVIYGSPAVVRVLGYTPGSLHGQNFLTYVHPSDRERVAEILGRLCQTLRASASVVVRFQHKDGFYRWLEGTGTNLLDAAGVEAVVVNYRDITERIEADAKLTASEARYRTMLHGVQAGVIVHGRDLSITAFNRRAAELLGVTEAQMKQRSPNDPAWRRVRLDGSPFPEDDLPFKRAFATRQPVRDVVIGMTRPATGDFVWMLADANPVLTADGEVSEVIVTFMDVSLRIQAEQAIRQTATFTEDVLDSLVAHVVVLDTTGVIISVNESWRNFARENGGGENAFIGSNYLAVCAETISHPLNQNAAAVADGVRQVLVGEASRFSLEYPYLTSGESRWFRMRVSPLRGDQRGAVVSHHDITDHVRSMEALSESEKRFKALFEQAAIGVAQTDAKTGRFTNINQRFCDLLGRSREEMMTLTFAAVTHPADAAASFDAMKRLTSGVIRECTNEKRYIRKNGAEVWANVTLSAMWAPGETPGCFIAVAQDITERKALEAQFRQAQKMEAVGQLSGGVAHDFNNLLTVIKGHIGLLQTTGQVTPSISASLEQISVAADRASNLTRQLLMFSSRQVMQPQVLDLHITVREMAKMLVRMVGEQISLNVSRSAGPLLIRADAGMIDQILLNLAVNARDAMPNGGPIEIATDEIEITLPLQKHWPESRCGRFARLSVTDAGSGISPEILPRIFEPFFTTKEVGKGTGLGLATVYGIVRQHEGWIDVQSKLHSGTTFTIYLPCAAGPTAVMRDVPTSLAPGSGHETILVVEDEPMVRMMIESLLSERGYRVLSAASGAEALGIWASESAKIDLLLTDVVMPGKLTGTQVAARMVKERPALRVIYMSGYSPEFAGKDFPLREGQNYLTKPFDANGLLGAIRATLEANAPATRTVSSTPLSR